MRNEKRVRINWEASQKSYDAGRSAMEADDFESAIVAFTESLAHAPHPKTFELLGECLMQRDRPHDALVYLAAAVGLGRNAFRARFLLARALIAVGEHQKAIEHLEDLIEANPTYKSARELLESLKGESVRPD